MKRLVNELCRKYDITLEQLADRMGVNLSDLSASLDGDPSPRLQNMAKELGVEARDPFEKKSEAGGVAGVVEVNGEAFRISSAEDWLKVSGMIPGFTELPVYENESDLLDALKKFIHEGVEREDCASLSGRYGSCEIFTLSRVPQEDYDAFEDTYTKDILFTLTLVGQQRTQLHYLIEFTDGDSYDIDGDFGLAMVIKCEITSLSTNP